jgi:hypothetical protein
MEVSRVGGEGAKQPGLGSATVSPHTAAAAAAGDSEQQASITM